MNNKWPDDDRPTESISYEELVKPEFAKEARKIEKEGNAYLRPSDARWMASLDTPLQAEKKSTITRIVVDIFAWVMGIVIVAIIFLLLLGGLIQASQWIVGMLR